MAIIAISISMIAFLLHAIRTEYRPKYQETLPTTLSNNNSHSINPNPSPIPLNSILSFITWNIGFGGFGCEADFFMDGGKMSNPSRQNSLKNMEGITQCLTNQAADFILLQEIDTQAKRSWYINQVAKITQKLPNHQATFTPNFKVSYIPYPPNDPIGEVESGLATISHYHATENIRQELPGQYFWPYSMFFLKRCFLAQRFPVANGKELIVINTHKSAYDGGRFKHLQMQVLKDTIEQEYYQGNYVVVGGDWNQCPPHFPVNTFTTANQTTVEESNIAATFLPNWQWAYDPTQPTNRKLDTPFDTEKSATTILDFYLLSPNIELIQVKTLDQQFAFSDHQPVYLQIQLKD